MSHEMQLKPPLQTPETSPERDPDSPVKGAKELSEEELKKAMFILEPTETTKERQRDAFKRDPSRTRLRLQAETNTRGRLMHSITTLDTSVEPDLVDGMNYNEIRNAHNALLSDAGRRTYAGSISSQQHALLGSARRSTPSVFGTFPETPTFVRAGLHRLFAGRPGPLARGRHPGTGREAPNEWKKYRPRETPVS